MSRRSIVQVLLALMASLLLVAAACAPTATPSQEKPAAAPAEQKAEPKPAAETKPAAQTQPAPLVPKPAEQPAAKTETKASPKTSVSGIPLDPQAKYGGILTLSYTIEGPNYSHWEIAAGVSSFVGNLTLNYLVRNRTWGTEEDYKQGAHTVLEPDLLKSWEQSADGLKWTFKLRDGVKWSDGVAFTCADAKWTLDSIRTGQGLKVSPRATMFLPVDKIECADPLTMVVTLKWPKPSFVEVVAIPFNLVYPQHKYANNTDPMRSDPPNPTTGPFRLKERLPAEKYVFERNQDYWDKPLPYVDGVEMRYMAPAAEVTAFRAGRIDVGTPAGYSGAQAELLLKECEVCAFWPRIVGLSWQPVFMVNHQRPPWNSPEVKEAISLAIDRRNFGLAGWQGWLAEPTGCGLIPGTAWAMPYERCKQIPGFNLDDPQGNKARARQLLEKAGYKPGELKGTVIWWDATERGSAVLIEDLKSVGIEITPRFQPFGPAYTAFTSGEFDLGMTGHYLQGMDPDFFLYEHFYTGSDRNYGRYSNPKLDRLIDEQSRTVDPERRKLLVWDAMEIVMREQAKIIGGHTIFLPTYSKRLRGLMPALNHFGSYGAPNRHDHTWLAEK